MANLYIRYPSVVPIIAGVVPVSCTQLPAVLGQTTMAGSLSVTLASDQSPVIVTNASAGNTGAAVPTVATYVGANKGGNLAGLSLDASGWLKVAVSTSVLPTGAATSAKQPALGTAGTASADVLSVQGIAGMTALTVAQATAANLNATVVGTGTFAVQATQAGTWNINNISGTVSLPTGAATETTLSGLSAKFGSLGQKAMAGSAPVVIASDQSAIPISGTVTTTNSANGATGAAVPAQATYIGGNKSGNLAGLSLDASGYLQVNVLASALPTGAATSAIQTGGSQKTQIVDGSGNVIASTSNALKTSAAQNGTWTVQPGNTPNTTPWLSKLNDGTNSFTVKAASTAAVAADTAVVVAISPNNTISATRKGSTASNAPVYNAYSGANITTAAYTQLVASTTSATNALDIFDSSGQAMILATGAAGAETVVAYIPPGGEQVLVAIPAGTRVAYKALTANATSGYLLINFWS